MRGRDIDETWTATQWELANFCLDQRRVELEIFVDEIAQANPTSVQRAIQAASSLEPIATCLDERTLAAMPALPDSETRSAAVGLRRQLSRAAYLEEAGRYDEGLRVIQAARREVGPESVGAVGRRAAGP